MHLEQDTDTIHDLLSLAGTSLPSLTGSKQYDIPMATTKRIELIVQVVHTGTLVAIEIIPHRKHAFLVQ